jgi:hypothetical protein
METDIRPIDDADLVPPPQHPLRRIEDEEEEDDNVGNTPIYFPQQQPHPMYKKSANIFEELDKTAYIIIFVAFILGFFMGKTMQPVILRPG